MASKKNPDISKHLEKWATNEMQIGRTLKTSISKSSFDKLCSGKLGNIWCYVMNHVKSKRTVAAIRAKLSKTNGQTNKHNNDIRCDADATNTVKGVEREMLKLEKTKLSTDILNMQRDSHAVKESVALTQSNLIKSEESYFAHNQSIQELRHSICIIGEFYMLSQKKASEIKNYSDSLQSLINDKISGDAEKDTIYFTQSDGRYVLETASMRDLRECIDAIQKFSLEVVSGKFITNRLQKKERKTELYKQTALVLKNNQASEILKCLVTLIQEKIQILKKELYELEVLASNDNQSQRQGSITLPSKAHVGEEVSLHILLKKSRIMLITKFFDVQRIKANIKHLEEKKLILVNEVNNNLVRVFLDQSEPLDTAKQAFESELQKAFANALLECMTSIQKELEQPLQTLCHCKNSIASKSLDIKRGHENLNKKRLVICSLKKGIEVAQSKFNNQLQINKEIVKKELENMPGKTIAMLLELKNCVSSEVETLKSVSLPYLTTVNLDNGIHFSEFLTISDRSVIALKRICAALGLTYKLAPETLYVSLLNMYNDVHNFRMIQRSQDALLKKLMANDNADENCALRSWDAEKLLELSKKIKKGYHQKLKIEHDLDQEIMRMDEFLVRYTEVEKLITVWWEQPIHRLQLPTNVDGIGFQTWKTHQKNC